MLFFMVLGGFNENQDLSDVALDRTCARKTGNPENPVSAVSFNRLLLRLQRHEPHKYKLHHRSHGVGAESPGGKGR